MTSLEAVLVVGLLGGLLGAATVYQQVTLRRAKELALTAQLRSLRARLAFLNGLHQARPASLQELVGRDSPRLRLGGGGWRDVESARAADLADPFGAAYEYDLKAGTVRSRSRGYESW